MESLVQNFVCPNCKERGKVEEFVKGVNVRTPITDSPHNPAEGLLWDEEGQRINYESSEDMYLMCGSCEETIVDENGISFTDVDEFGEYLKRLREKNDMPDIFDVDVKNPATLKKRKPKIERANPTTFEKNLI